MYFSVIIPAYNEEKRLPKTLEAISDYLKKQNYQSEIIVADGGSNDRTLEVVGSMMSKIENLKAVQARFPGKGLATSTGMLAAQGQFRVFTDADNSTSIDQVEKMWPEFKQGFDVVIGSRNVRGAILDPPQPFFRKAILGEGFKLFRRILVGLWDISDTQCGFKGFTERAAKEIFSQLTITGFAFDVEVLVLARIKGYKIKEIPIRWVNDLESKVKLKHIMKIFSDIFRVRLNSIRGIYDKKI